VRFDSDLVEPSRSADASMLTAAVTPSGRITLPRVTIGNHKLAGSGPNPRPKAGVLTSRGFLVSISVVVRDNFVNVFRLDEVGKLMVPLRGKVMG
jgi:hypothetical protein